jgi:hypothetical protein
VHPAVLEHYLNGSLGAAARQLAEQVEKTNDRSPHALRQEEIALLDLLERKIAAERAA